MHIVSLPTIRIKGRVQKVAGKHNYVHRPMQKSAKLWLSGPVLWACPYWGFPNHPEP